MIHVKRNALTPAAFKSKAIAADKKRYTVYYSRSASKRSQEKFSDEVTGDTPETLLAVAKAFKYKCAACETQLELKEMVCDSWRPRQNAQGFNNEIARDHYWWLAYEWKNKYALCSRCNNYKGSWFPVEGKRAPLKSPYLKVIRKEKALLIDPCKDYPEEHMWVDVNSGHLLPRSKKGEVTIEILKLNRVDLLKSRRKIIESFEKMIDPFDKITTYEKSHRPIKRKVVSDIIMFTLSDFVAVLSNHPEGDHVMLKRQLIFSAIALNPLLQSFTYFRTIFRTILDTRQLGKAKEMVTLMGRVFAEKKMGLTYKPKQYLPPTQEKKPARSAVVRPAKKGARKKDDILITKPGSYQVLSANTDIRKDTSGRDKASNESLLRLYPERIEINNFKSISKLSFKFNIPPPKHTGMNVVSQLTREPWKFLLGENGMGKSSILQAIALALAGDEYISTLELAASSILRHGKRKGSVKVWLVGIETPATLTFTSTKINSNFTTGTMNVLAYGSTRVWPKGEMVPEQSKHSIKIKNLFDYSVALADVTKWLLRIDDVSFNEAARALKDVLDLKSEETYFIREDGRVYFSQDKVTLEELSEGYRSVLALAGDIMKSLSDRNTHNRKGAALNYEVMEGIVLIDEISSHLHPSWQMKIVKAFRRAFPRLQFVVTSHDPLSLKGVEKGEVVLLRKKDKETICITDLPDPTELRAEQLLTSEFFGLNSTLDPELEMQFNTYHELLAKDKLTDSEQKQLSDLKVSLKDKKHLGSSLREELLYDAIDTTLAKYNLMLQTQNRQSLFTDTRKKVEDIWSDLYKEEK